MQWNICVQYHRYISSGADPNNMKYTYVCVACTLFIAFGHMRHKDIVVIYVHMNVLAPVAYMWDLRGILVFGMYMAITYFMSNDADRAFNDTSAFQVLK